MTVFFSVIWGFLTSKLAGPIATAAALAMGAALFVAHIQAGVLHGEIKSARAGQALAVRNLDTANLSLRNVQAALDAQGAAVAGLKAESAAR